LHLQLLQNRLYRYFVDSGNIVSLLFFSRLVVPEYFKPEKTAVDFALCVKAPSQQSTATAVRRSVEPSQHVLMSQVERLPYSSILLATAITVLCRLGNFMQGSVNKLCFFRDEELG